MASGEGKDVVSAELEKKILAGDFLHVVKKWKKDLEYRSVPQVVSILCNIYTFTSKSKDKTSGKIVANNFNGLAELTALCCQFLAEKEELVRMKDGTSLFSKAVFYIHFILYELYNAGLFVDVSTISQNAFLLASHATDVDDEEKKKKLMKSFFELGSIAWNTAFKLKDDHGCPKTDLAISSLELSVKFDELQDPTFSSRAIRVMNACSNSLPCLKDLLRNLSGTCEPLMTAIIANVSFMKELAVPAQALLRSINIMESHAVVKSKIAEVQSLFPKTYSKEIKKLTLPYHTLSLLTSESHEPINIAELNKVIQEDDTGSVANTVCKLILANKLYKEKTSECVKFIQEICFTCLTNLRMEKKFELVSHMLVMSSAHVPKTRKVNGWTDSCSLSLYWALEALELIAEDLVADNVDFIGHRIKIFHNIFAVSWNFYSNANCCYEAFLLNKFFLKHAFQLTNIKQLSANYYESIMGSLTQGTKFVCTSLVSGRPGREKEMAREALKAGAKLLKCSAISVTCLPEKSSRKIILCSVKKWCEIRILTSKVLEDRASSTKDILKSLGHNIDTKAMEVVLCCEIETFSKERNAEDFLKVSTMGLETLETKSKEGQQQHWTKLCIAQGKFKSEDLSEVTASCSLVQELTEKLRKEVKSDPNLENLTLLISAYFQEFLSSLKVKQLKHKELGDVPLTVRSQTNVSQDEQKTCEEWENAVELSKLAQVLSCRQENKDLRPLSLIMNLCNDILKLRISSDDSFMLEPVLRTVEATGLHFTNSGHDWCAIKCWNCLYLLGSLIECPQSQMRALGWLIQKYNMDSDEKFLQWLLKTGTELKEKIAAETSNLQSEFTLRFFDICLAQCYANSGKPIEAAHIVLRLRREIDHNKNFISGELMCRTFLVASQIMGALSGRDEEAEQLATEFVGNILAAQFAFDWSSSYVSTTKPADRDLLDLRLVELMISSGLVLSQISNLSCNYKTACSTLQIMLQKVQKLHLSTRVAQLLSLLGDLDILIPDTTQVNQRLFWNEKILNLGTAIVGSRGGGDASPTATPIPNTRKEYQLTASCSAKCQNSSSCILCKNPLFQICKTHYLFLSANNKEAFWTLFRELEKANTLRADRLTSLAWNNIVSVLNRSGWMQLLQGPLELLKHRQVLANAAIKASKSGSVQETLSAMKDVLVTKEQLKKLTMPIARYLENWMCAEEVAIGIQLLGIGPWDPKLQSKCYSLAPEYNSEEDISRPCSPVPNIVLPSKPPKPQKIGRRRVLKDDDDDDSSIYIAPAIAPKIAVINLSEDSSEESESAAAKKKRAVTKRNLLKTCKKPEPDKSKEGSNLQPSISPVLPSRTSKRLLKKPTTSNNVATTPSVADSKKKMVMTEVRKPASKMSSSSNDSPVLVKQPAKRTTRGVVVVTSDSPPSSLEDDAVSKRRVIRISSSPQELASNARTRLRRK